MRGSDSALLTSVGMLLQHCRARHSINATAEKNSDLSMEQDAIDEKYWAISEANGVDYIDIVECTWADCKSVSFVQV